MVLGAWVCLAAVGAFGLMFARAKAGGRQTSAAGSQCAASGVAHTRSVREERVESTQARAAGAGSASAPAIGEAPDRKEDIPQDVEALLASADSESFLLGVRTLVMRGTTDDVIRMVEIIEGAGDEDRRREIVAAACGIRNASAVPVLFEILKTATEPEFVDMAQRALGGMPGERVLRRTVQQYWSAGSEEERDRLLGVIRYASGPDAVAVLEEIADRSGGDYAQPMGLAAIDTLAVQGSPGAVSNLLNRFRSSPESGQLAAAVGRVSGRDALQTLLQAAGADDSQFPWTARLAAVRALGNYRGRDVEDFLTALGRETGLPPEMRDAVGRSLLKVRGEYGTDFSR